METGKAGPAGRDQGWGGVQPADPPQLRHPLELPPPVCFPRDELPPSERERQRIAPLLWWTGSNNPNLGTTQALGGREAGSCLSRES